MVIWPVLAASLAFGSETGACPYTYNPLDHSFPPRTEPLPPDQCAFISSLEEPLRRIVAVASIDPDGIILNPHLRPGKFVDASYADGRGIDLSAGFASCLLNDRAAAIGILCHEVGHAVQWRGGDPSARAVLVRLHSPGTIADFDDPETAALNRDMERHADLVGRELCARAGFPLDFEAMPKAFMRCNGSVAQPLHSLPDHPSDAERLETSRADAPRLSEQRAREIGAAIRRRARRLLAGAPTDGDDALDLSLTPRDWALTPAADRDRLTSPYKPSRTLRELGSVDVPSSLSHPSN